MQTPLFGDFLHIAIQNVNSQNFSEIRQKILNCLVDLETDYRQRGYIESEWTENELGEWVYKSQRKLTTENEQNNYFCKNLCTGIRYFKLLLNSCKSYEHFKRRKSHMSSYIYDLARIIESLERQHNENYKFMDGYRSYYTDSQQVRWATVDLFWQNPTHTIEIQKIAFVLSVVTLRQSLEIRFKRICGIERLYSDKFLSPKFFLNFVKDNHKYFKLPPNFSIDNTIKIYDWTHKIVHNAELPLIWEIALALDITLPLFRGGIHKIPNGTIQKHIHGAVTINNFDEMRDKLQKDIAKKLKISIEDLNIIWAKAPEAVIDNEAFSN